MKIAIYTIALNEAQFAERWAATTSDADCRLVADTGSSDATAAKLRAAGVLVPEIRVSPWRFDHARNAALEALPSDIDICLSIDMDEVLLPGWRAQLEAAWTSNATRLRYKLISNWDADGKPHAFFFSGKCHARHGYRWRYPAHELVYPDPGVTEHLVWARDLVVHHLADKTKSRAQYLPLMRLAVAEAPGDPRPTLHLGFELMNHAAHAEAVDTFRRYLGLPDATNPADRGAALRYLARCHEKLGEIAAARAAFQAACVESPDAREPFFELAKFCLAQKDYAAGIAAVHACLAITEMPGDHVRLAKAWDVGPYDVGSLCAHFAGDRDLARLWLTEALTRDPGNPRLIRNSRSILAP